MPTLPTSLFWTRLDTTGCDHALLADQNGLRARGTVLAASPLPHTCQYQLTTDPLWATTWLEVTAEGAGWQRRVRLQRTGEGWRVTTSEQGDLARAAVAAGLPRPEPPGIEDRDRLVDAIDVDLAAAPLFNTLPVRRLELAAAPPGSEHHLTMVWVALPSLVVTPSEQTYTVLGADRVRYASAGFAAELALDDAGYVIHYPGLARRPA